MSDNNYYFETLRKITGELDEEAIVSRIGECTTILNELTMSKAWDTVLKDNKKMSDELDSMWQDIPTDNPKLKEARVLKIATKHILDLPMKYAQELDMLQAELHKRQNPQQEIEKDSDNA